MKCLCNYPWLLKLLAKLVEAAILNDDWRISLNVCQSISLWSWSRSPFKWFSRFELLQRWNLS